MDPVADPRLAFAAELRLAIDNVGWSQQRVASEVGVSQQTVSGWLLGKTIPELPTLERLAALLGASVEDWVALKMEALSLTPDRRARRLSPEDRAAEGRLARPLPPGAAALSGKIDRLTPSQRAKIEALVDEMLPDEPELEG